jgi:hypothetical protein
MGRHDHRLIEPSGRGARLDRSPLETDDSAWAAFRPVPGMTRASSARGWATRSLSPSRTPTAPTTKLGCVGRHWRRSKVDVLPELPLPSIHKGAMNLQEVLVWILDRQIASVMNEVKAKP